MGGLKLLSFLLAAERKLKYLVLAEEANVWLDQIITGQFIPIRSLNLDVLRFTCLITSNVKFEEVGGQLISFASLHSLMICYGYCKTLGSLNSYCRVQRQLLPLWIDFPAFRSSLNYALWALYLQKNSRSCFILGMCEIYCLVIAIFNAAM